MAAEPRSSPGGFINICDASNFVSFRLKGCFTFFQKERHKEGRKEEKGGHKRGRKDMKTIRMNTREGHKEGNGKMTQMDRQ